MTLRRWMTLSVILLVPGFVLMFLSRTVFVPEAGVIGGLLLAAGLVLCGPAQTLWPRFKAALYDRQPAGRAQTAALLALGFACLVLLVSGTYNPFIYFRF